MPPWDKYQTSFKEIGPWNNYAAPSLEPAPFAFDDHINKELMDVSDAERPKTRDAFASTLHAVAAPWMATGYTAMSALNRGTASFYDNLDTMARWIERQGAGKREGLFEKMADISTKKADYWKEQADKVGVHFMEELVGEAVGGAVPGITDFALKVASGFSIPAAVGMQKAYEHDQDPFIGGLLEAAKTGALSGMFRMMAPFSRYLQATVMGATFGTQEAIDAPEGHKLKGFAKGVGTGALFSMTAPGGDWGLRDVYPEIGRTVPEIRKEMEAGEQKPVAGEPASIRRGPGAATAGPQDPDITELTENLSRMPRDTSFDQKQSVADQLKKDYTGVLGKAQGAWAGIKGSAEAAWDWYKAPPKWTTFDEMLGKYTGGRQVSSIKTDRFAKQIQESMPARKQVATSVFVQAGGNEATIQKWAEATKDPALKQGYEDALTLTPEEKGFAQNIQGFWERKLNEAVDAGILDHGVENYVTQLWEKNPDNPVAKRLITESNAGMLRKNPAFAKKRIFESYFEGEQAGFSPKDKRIGFLVSAYQRSFDEAINARSFVKSLSEAKGSDGKPLAVTMGAGSALPKGEEPAEQWMIKPHAVSAPKKVNQEKMDELVASGMDPKEAKKQAREPIDLSGYKVVDHAALRKWKWAAADNDGKPIFVEGDLLVHPEAYGKLKNILGASAIAGNPVGKALLKGSSLVKGTMLGFFSTFHQTHLGQHLLTHGVSPLSPPSIDLDNPLTAKLIEHGLMLHDGNAMAQFHEGLTGPGLIKYIPKLGPLAQQYTDYLFGADGYISRAKNMLASTLYERNTERYPNLSDNQIAKLSADQANAALGGQNYLQMGRNKTMQDLFRLAGLAPDFLESRIRFTGQAAAPYGREQFTALVIRGAIGMYIGAKLFEGAASLIDDDTKIHWDRPFSVTVGEKEYAIRSMQGDILHLVSDPRSFVYYRLNPGLVKPAIEALTGRDEWGRKKDITSQVKDWATTSVPIAGQGFFKKEDYDIYQSVLQSIGVSSWHAETEAEKVMKQLQDLDKQIEKSVGSKQLREIKKIQRTFSIRKPQE